MRGKNVPVVVGFRFSWMTTASGRTEDGWRGRELDSVVLTTVNANVIVETVVVSLSVPD